MLKVYADETLTDYKKGPFKRPVSGLDITLDCNRYQNDDSTEETIDEEEWDPNAVN
jgi:hypothetical protein